MSVLIVRGAGAVVDGSGRPRTGDVVSVAEDEVVARLLERVGR